MKARDFYMHEVSPGQVYFREEEDGYQKCCTVLHVERTRSGFVKVNFIERCRWHSDEDAFEQIMVAAPGRPFMCSAFRLVREPGVYEDWRTLVVSGVEEYEYD